MNKKQVDNFFEVLNQEIKGGIKGRVRIILTGAIAGMLMGGRRPSIDIDFCIDCNRKYLKEIEDAIKKTSDITGIAANFSEDIDRWSQITFLDYRRHTMPYKTFGKITVSILSPDYWSIGKIARYLDPDIDDLIKVLKNNSISPLKLAKLWGKALIKSPRSNASFVFKRQAEHFLKTYGKYIWGKGYDEDKCIAEFRKSSQFP
jgi:hypothetical protein